jgi:hypothetical protein
MHRLVILIALLAPLRAHADCALVGLKPSVLTPAASDVPLDGGIVVGAMPEPEGKLEQGDAAVQASWRIRAGNDVVKPPIESIAPGLAVYRVAVANVWKVELVDGARSVLATIRTTRSAGAALAAPKVKKIWYETNHSRHASDQIRVELDGTVPAGAVALVLADDKGVARSWGTPSQAPLVVYGTRGCEPMPNGTTPTRTGDKVALFWLDAGGRRSPATKTLTIAPK